MSLANSIETNFKEFYNQLNRFEERVYSKLVPKTLSRITDPSYLKVPTAVTKQALIKLGIKINKKNAQGYFVLQCPFHKNGKEKIPSLNLHSSNGYYKCHACGIKGGSIINFYIKVTGKSFKEAVKDLNF